MSKLIFIRSYLIIVFLILIVGIGLDRLLDHFSSDETVSIEKQHLQVSFLYVKTRLQQSQNISAGWQENQLSIQAELGFPVALYQLSDFSDQGQFVQSLTSENVSEMAVEDGEIIYYQQLPESDFIIALGPLISEQQSVFTDNILIAMYYLLIASALFIWLRPMSDDLHELRKVAIGFGEEDFSSRVNLRKSSSISLVANAFNSMAQRIQDLVSAHQDLTHAVSHELKTPLSRFKFSLEIISDLEDVEQIKSYLQAMKGDVRELDDLIDEMMSYAKFSAQNLKLNLESINTEQWVEQIISQYADSPIKISTSLGSPFLGAEKTITVDRHLMSRTLHNLIRNGLRYAQWQLKVTLKKKDNKQIMILIDDDGPGIPEQSLEQVFQPFSRLDTSRDRQSGGYGLGLAICQKIVQQHGGTIVAEKSPLGGARFRLEFKDYSDNDNKS